MPKSLIENCWIKHWQMDCRGKTLICYSKTLMAQSSGWSYFCPSGNQAWQLSCVCAMLSGEKSAVPLE